MEVAEVKLGRREKNKQQNRKAILVAGLQVFSEIGFERATISDVVKASGLSVGTFYNYYGDKESVFKELVDRFVAEGQQALSKAREKADSLDSFVSDAYHAFGDFLFQSPEMQQLMVKNPQAFRQFLFASPKMERIFSEMEADMEEGIRAGLLPPFPVRLMVAAMIGAGAEVYAFDGGASNASIAEKSRFLSDVFVYGIKALNKKEE